MTLFERLNQGEQVPFERCMSVVCVCVWVGEATALPGALRVNALVTLYERLNQGEQAVFFI